jgi:hypothetical protein
MTLIIKAGSATQPGDIRAMGRGDKIIVLRESVTDEAWPTLWDAIGVAVRRGAELRITDLRIV